MKIPAEEFFREEKDLHYRETDTFSHLLWQMTEDIHRYLLGLFINKGYFKYTTGFTEMCNQTFAEMCKHKAEDHMNEIK